MDTDINILASDLSRIRFETYFIWYSYNWVSFNKPSNGNRFLGTMFHVKLMKQIKQPMKVALLQNMVS